MHVFNTNNISEILTTHYQNISNPYSWEKAGLERSFIGWHKGSNGNHNKNKKNLFNVLCYQ